MTLRSFSIIYCLNFNSNQQSKYLFFLYLFIVLLANSNAAFVVFQRFGICWRICFSLFLILFVLCLFRFRYFRWRFLMGHLFKFWKTYWLLYFYRFFFLKLIKDILLLDWSLFYCDFDSTFILFACLGCPLSFIHRQTSESLISLVQLLFHFKELLFGNWSCFFNLNHLLFLEFYWFFS